MSPPLQPVRQDFRSLTRGMTCEGLGEERRAASARRRHAGGTKATHTDSRRYRGEVLRDRCRLPLQVGGTKTVGRWGWTDPCCCPRLEVLPVKGEDENRRFRLWRTDSVDFSKVLWAETRPTTAQTRAAERLGVPLEEDDTFLIASARIIDAVCDAIGDTPVHAPTDRQKVLATAQGVDIAADTRRVAWAKIKTGDSRAEL